MILDFLATFPYYLIRYHKIDGVVSLRLLRFFRVFQLLKLQKYDMYLTAMMRIFTASVQAIHIYLLTLLFLAAVFASIIYWFERGKGFLGYESIIYNISITYPIIIFCAQ